MLISTVANAAPNKKFDFLLRFFDLNEAAFAYQRHCLSTSEQLDAKFLKTMEFVADELFDESIKNNPTLPPEHIKAKILERRYNLQYRLDHANMQTGCASRDTETAKAHYLEFSRFNRAQIKQYIEDKTQEN